LRGGDLYGEQEVIPVDRKKRAALLAFLAAACAGPVAPPPPQAPATERTRAPTSKAESPPLSPAKEPTSMAAIPPADPAMYKGIRDARDWKNPYLIVGANLHTLILGEERRSIAPSELEAALLALPASAWPYGRIIAAQEQPIRESASVLETEAIVRNKAALEATLQALGLQISWWPTAGPVPVRR
jgi:hypothetical protein